MANQGKVEVSPQFIIDLREKMGVTQAALSQRIEVTITTISRWENGLCQPQKYHRNVLRRLDKKYPVKD